eukprot:GILJ01012152.1.p1 GENE.GILJ01012152.1~~GILJ01012152.1.p1  ORF type:complete len:608 (+),score=46.32 GILJ01012152.1:967-2790(+)
MQLRGEKKGTQIIKALAGEMKQNTKVHLDYDKQVQRIRQTMAAQLGKAEWADRALRRLLSRCYEQHAAFLDDIPSPPDDFHSSTLTTSSSSTSSSVQNPSQTLDQRIEEVVGLHQEWLVDLSTAGAERKRGKRKRKEEAETDKRPRVQRCQIRTYENSRHQPLQLFQYLQQMQRWREKHGGRSFPIIPLRTIQRASISIDPASLKTMLLHCHAIGSQPARDPNELWDLYIGGPDAWRKGWTTHHSLHTDGVTATILLHQPRQVGPVGLRDDDKQNEPAAGSVDFDRFRQQGRGLVKLSALATPSTTNVLQTCTLVSVDPGVRDLMTMYHWPTGDDNGKEREKGRITRLTRGQYYHESGIIRNRLIRERWRRPLQQVDAAMSLHSCRTADKQSHWNYLAVKWANDQALWDEALKPRYSNLHFRQSAAKNRCLDRFVRREFGRPGTVVAMGDAKFSVTATGKLTGKTKSVIDRIRHRVPVVMVNEYLTSRKCSSCEGLLMGVTFKSRRAHNDSMLVLRANALTLGICSTVHECRQCYPLREERPWGLRRCLSTFCRSTGGLLHRDGNAAVNIGRAFLGVMERRTRPAYLCPAPASVATVRPRHRNRRRC